MARDGGSRQADHWQRKYYAALEELEEKEKAWGETEALLRRLATRLTLAADPLKTLFARLPVPDVLARQRRYVERQLEKADTPEAVRKVAGDLAELVLLLLQRRPPDAQTADETSAGEAAPVDEGGGLIASLFGRRREREAAKAPVNDDLPASEPMAESPPAAPVMAPDQCRHAAETLIRLLEQSHWPDPLHTEAELLKRRLEACDDEAALQAGLLATAELFNGLQARVQREKRELEAFLRQLTERLAELDRDIRTTARLQAQSEQSERDMDTRVREEVSGIERSVADAEDLDTLKTAVQSRVILIRDHMDRFLERQRGAARDEVAALRAEADAAREAAMTDQLTGIPNRLAYDRRLDEELARFKRYGSPFVLQVWDVDRFKAINDTYGHAAGDKVLTIIARHLHDSVRETDLVARYGGEEFVILMPETDAAHAQPVADKLRESIAAIARR